MGGGRGEGSSDGVWWRDWLWVRAFVTYASVFPHGHSRSHRYCNSECLRMKLAEPTGWTTGTHTVFIALLPYHGVHWSPTSHRAVTLRYVKWSAVLQTEEGSGTTTATLHACSCPTSHPGYAVAATSYCSRAIEANDRCCPAVAAIAGAASVP